MNPEARRDAASGIRGRLVARDCLLPVLAVLG
jgi:hypothetical protein